MRNARSIVMNASAASAAFSGLVGTIRPLNATTSANVVVTTAVVVNVRVVGADVSSVGSAAVREIVSDADELHALDRNTQIVAAKTSRREVDTTDSFARLAHRFDVHDLALCEWVSPAASTWRASGTSMEDG